MFLFLRWVKRHAEKVRPIRRPALGIEGLEDRALPATALFAIDPSIVATARLEFDGPMARAGYDLSTLYAQFKASPASFQSTNSLLQVSDDRVVVDVLPQNDLNSLRSDLNSLGFDEIAEAPAVISGTMPIASLEAAAQLPSVRAIQPAYAPITSIGSVTSQGLKAQQSDKVLNYLGLDGTGKTVGVLSDSFNSLGGASADAASGDLPGPGNPYGHTTPVNVLDDSLGGSDEGRAMLQLVHDVAPGANLAFATAGAAQTQFRNNIVALANAGANVLVDDFTFLTEPMFQDGIVAQAVDRAVGAGIAYFSAAGNLGKASYQQAFRNSGADLVGTGPYTVPAALSSTFMAHDFNPVAGSPDLFQTITIPPGKTSFSFQWSNPFFSNGGGLGATTNLDIAVFDMAGNFLNIGGFNNNVGADPVEVFTIANPNTTPMQVQIAIGKANAGPDPTLMKYVAFGPANGTVSVDEYATNSSTIFGHANAAGAETVGASLYSETPPYGVSPPQLEPYSGRGGTPILFNTTGLPLLQPQTRQTPDIVAPDGVDTTFFGRADPMGSGPFEGDGYPNFFGTSAAAPQAAGVAALLMQAKGLSPQQVYNALESTAIDIGPAGYDSDSGWGLINAAAAVISLDGGPYTVKFTGSSANDNLLIRRDSSGQDIEFLQGGVVQLSIPADQVGSIQVNGLGGNDSLTLDSTNGAIDRAIAYNGGAGSDSLIVVGTADFPAELNVSSDAAAIPTITINSGFMPSFTFTSVEAATLASTNGIVNLIGDNGGSASQADLFVVRGTGPDAFTASLNNSPAIQFQSVTALNVSGKTSADTLAVSPWASNSPAGWGVQTYYDGGGSSDGDLLVYNTVAANPVSEDVAIQPAAVGSGEVRANNAIDGSAIAVISYVNSDLAVNDSDGFTTDTDTLTLRGTNQPDDFVVNLNAAGTSSSPMVDVRPGSGLSFYKLRFFTGFSTLGILGQGGNDTVDLISGRDDGTVGLSIDLGLPVGGPNLTDRDVLQVYGADGGNDLFRYTPGLAPGAGHIDITRAGSSAATPIDFSNVEQVGFNGGSPADADLTGSDLVALNGTSGSDTFTLTSTGAQTASGQVDGGPLLDFNHLGTSGSSFSLDGLDGNDVFTVTQSVNWGLASISIDGGGGFDNATIYGSSHDDVFTYTPSSMVLGVDAGGGAVPYFLSRLSNILADALGQVGGDRLVITEKIGYTPTANSGTLPTNPPFSYRNFELFTVDQLPVLSDDFATTPEDTPVMIDELANDTGTGDAPLTITIANPPTHGLAQVVGNQIQYTPTANYNNGANGPDHFTYQVSDANGDTATALITVSVAPVNDPPVAISSSVQTDQNTPVNFSLPADDGDPEVVQTLTYSIASGPFHGVITSFDPTTGAISYTPNSLYAGADTIAFVVTDDATAGGAALVSNIGAITITVHGVNDAPTALPENLSTAEDTALSFTLAGDDGDSEVTQALTYTIVTGPQHGTIINFSAATGKGTYIPAPNYNGPDRFTVTVTDDSTAGPPGPLTSSSAVIAITVNPTNDPPIANPLNLSGPEDNSLIIDLSGDDGDPEVVQGLTYALTSAPSHGQITSFDAVTGVAVYQPDADFAGTDTFTYTVKDDNTAGPPASLTSVPGLVTITVTPVNDPPIAFAQNTSTAEDTPLTVSLDGDDSDPEVNQTLTYAIITGPRHGTLTNFNAATGHATYVPNANYNGPDQFTFAITDDATAGGPALSSSPATISLTITAVNDSPTAISQSITVAGNGSVILTLTGDDGDPELAQSLSYSSVSGPSHGTLSPLIPVPGQPMTAARFLYVPKPGYVGSDSISFTNTDDGTPPLTSPVATVSINVTKPPDGIIVTGAGEGGGPHVEVFNARTGVLLHSFFAYDSSFSGGVRVATGDVDGDGIPDIITGAGVGGFPHIKIFSGKDMSLLASFFAFDDSFTGGVSVAAGDVDAEGKAEVIVGAGPGAGPHVRTFTYVDGQMQQLAGPLGSFFAFEPSFTGGVNVTAGNYDGVPGDEIIVGAASLGGPHVEVFNAQGTMIASFFAFPDPILGVTVAAGDLDGDGKAEIITGPGVGGGPIVQVFQGGTAQLMHEFPAFDPEYRGGIDVGVADTNLDGIPDLLIAPGQSSRSVQIFDGDSLDLLDEFNAYGSNFPGGVYVAGK